MTKKNNYIEWIFNLESFLNKNGIDYSDYDEFYIKDVIIETEKIIKEHSINDLKNITESIINDYTKNAIEKNPTRKEYYETISFYVKKRFL